MRYFFSHLKAHAKRIAAMVSVFAVAAAVLAYFLGFYDISFIDRAALLGPRPGGSETENAGPETGPGAGETELSQGNPPAGTPGEPADPGTQTPPDDGEKNSDSAGNDPPDRPQDPTVQSGTVVDVVNTALLSDVPRTVASVAHMEKNGYQLSAADWSQGARLGKMSFDFRLTNAFSTSDRTVQKTQYVYPENNSEYYAETVSVTEPRPAIELYMGYILYYYGDKLYLLESDGTALFSFDDTITVPAYTRDANGTPLFYRMVWNAEESVPEKEYYRVSDSKTGFAAVDYDEALHGRGLYFDYPAYYGLSDKENLVRMLEGEEAVLARQDAEAQRVAALTPEELAAEEEDRKLNKTFNGESYGGKKYAYYNYGTDVTGYRFLQAYNFRNGLAAVTGYDYRNALFFINEYGYGVLSGNRIYYSSYERYVIESWRLPASFGIESLGSFYFDHGLVRVRRQMIDQWVYQAYDNIQVISDEDILINTKGKQFPLPAGYTLKAYSCGMILLEKNGLYGFMDYTGNWIAEPVYTAATPFINNLATLTTADGRTGMIDTAGKIVLPFAYDSITQASSGIIASYRKETGWQVYQIMVKS